VTIIYKQTWNPDLWLVFLYKSM